MCYEDCHAVLIGPCEGRSQEEIRSGEAVVMALNGENIVPRNEMAQSLTDLQFQHQVRCLA